MDFNGMKRKELQALCKKHGIKANLTNPEMASRLSSLLNHKEEEKTLSADTEMDSVIVTKIVKKVRFSPENETFIFVGTDIESDSDYESKKKCTRKRKSKVGKNLSKKKKVEEEKSVRVSRSRAQSSSAVVVEEDSEKRVRRGQENVDEPRRESIRLQLRSRKESVTFGDNKLEKRAKPEKVPENSKGNLKKKEKTSSSSEDLRKNGYCSRRITRARTRSNGNDSAVNNDSQRGAIVEIQEECPSVVLQLEEPPKGLVKKGRVVSELVAGEYIEHGQVMKKKLRRRSNNMESEKVSEVELNVDAKKQSLLEGPLRRTRYSTRLFSLDGQLTTHETGGRMSPVREAPVCVGKPTRRSTRNTSRQVSVETSDKVSEIAEGFGKCRRNKVTRGQVLNERSSVVAQGPVNEKPARQSKRNISKRKMVEQSKLTSRKGEKGILRESPVAEVRFAVPEDLATETDPALYSNNEVAEKSAAMGQYDTVPVSAVNEEVTAVIEGDKDTNVQEDHQYLVEFDPIGNRDPVQDHISEFSERQEPVKDAENWSHKAEILCTVIPNDITKERAEGNPYGEIACSNTAVLLQSTFVPEIQDGIEVPDETTFNIETSFHEGQSNLELRTPELPSIVQEAVCGGSRAKLWSGGSVLRVFDKNDGQVDDKQIQEDSEGCFDNVSYKTNDEKADQPNVIMYPDPAIEKHALNEGGPGSLPHFTSEKVQEEKEYDAPMASNEMGSMACEVTKEASNEVTQTTLQIENADKLDEERHPEIQLYVDLSYDSPEASSRIGLVKRGSWEPVKNAENSAQEAEKLGAIVPHDIEKETIEEGLYGEVASSYTAAILPPAFEPESQDEIEVPDETTFSRVTSFSKEQCNHGKIKDLMKTKENDNEEASSSVLPSVVQEVIHEDSEGKLQSGGSVLSILGKNDGQFDGKKNQEDSYGCFDEVSHESNDEKAGKKSLSLFSDFEVEKDAFKEDCEPGSPVHFTSEKLQDEQDGHSPNASNEMGSAAYEVPQAVLQIEQSKFVELERHNDFAFDLTRSTSFAANDANIKDSIGRMDKEFDAIAEANSETANCNVVTSEVAPGILDYNLDEGGADNMKDGDRRVTVNNAHKNLEVPEAEDETDATCSDEKDDDNNIDNANKLDEENYPEIKLYVDLSTDSPEACSKIELELNVSPSLDNRVSELHVCSAEFTTLSLGNGQEDDGSAIIQEYMEREAHADEFIKIEDSYASENDERSMTGLVEIKGYECDATIEPGIDNMSQDSGKEEKKEASASCERTEMEEDDDGPLLPLGRVAAERVLPEHTIEIPKVNHTALDDVSVTFSVNHEIEDPMLCNETVETMMHHDDVKFPDPDRNIRASGDLDRSASKASNMSVFRDVKTRGSEKSIARMVGASNSQVIVFDAETEPDVDEVPDVTMNDSSDNTKLANVHDYEIVSTEKEADDEFTGSEFFSSNVEDEFVGEPLISPCKFVDGGQWEEKSSVNTKLLTDTPIGKTFTGMESEYHAEQISIGESKGKEMAPAVRAMDSPIRGNNELETDQTGSGQRRNKSKEACWTDDVDYLDVNNLFSSNSRKNSKIALKQIGELHLHNPENTELSFAASKDTEKDVQRSAVSLVTASSRDEKNTLDFVDDLPLFTVFERNLFSEDGKQEELEKLNEKNLADNVMSKTSEEVKKRDDTVVIIAKVSADKCRHLENEMGSEVKNELPFAFEDGCQERGREANLLESIRGSTNPTRKSNSKCLVLIEETMDVSFGTSKDTADFEEVLSELQPEKGVQCSDISSVIASPRDSMCLNLKEKSALESSDDFPLFTGLELNLFSEDNKREEVEKQHERNLEDRVIGETSEDLKQAEVRVNSGVEDAHQEKGNLLESITGSANPFTRKSNASFMVPVTPRSVQKLNAITMKENIGTTKRDLVHSTTASQKSKRRPLGDLQKN